jgi:predicted dehydrogenase
VVAACDCLYIASPPASHLAYARLALAAGRAVFCEKPLSVDVAEAHAFVATAQGARAAVNFPMASAFAVEQLRGWTNAGVVGTPRTLDIEVAFATWPRGWQRDAAAWLDRPVGGGLHPRGGVAPPVPDRTPGRPVHPAGAVRGVPRGREERTGDPRAPDRRRPAGDAGGVGGHHRQGRPQHLDAAGSAGAIRLRDWSTAERLVDGTWQADGDTIPHEMLRPLVLRRQLEAVAAMTRGEVHPLATLAEALAVQEAVETILAG